MEDRRSLFRSSSILSHVEGDGPTAFIHKRITESTQLSGGGPDKCTSYFIEPVQWMEPALLGVMEGQVNVLYYFILFVKTKQTCYSLMWRPPHTVLGLPASPASILQITDGFSDVKYPFIRKWARDLVGMRTLARVLDEGLWDLKTCYGLRLAEA